MTSDDSVHEGLEGWLFLKKDANLVFDLYRPDSVHLPDESLLRWRRLIETRKRKAENLGVRYEHVIVPDKLTIYGARYTPSLVDPELSPARRLAQVLMRSPAADAVLDLVAPFRAASSEHPLYWKTDTHLTPEGSVLAYQVLCARLGLAPHPSPLSAPHHRQQVALDLGAKLFPAVLENHTTYHFCGQAVRVYVNRIAKMLENPEYEGKMHVGSRCIYKNPHARNDTKMLVFGDSHARIDGTGLTGLLAETVREVEFIWTSNIDWSHVRRVKPDILISESAERFMTVVPRDRVLLKVLEWRQIWRSFRHRRRSSAPT